MKHLIIIGGGGMGKEVFYTAKHSVGFGTEFDIKGFLDDNLEALEGIALHRIGKQFDKIPGNFLGRGGNILIIF